MAMSREMARCGLFWITFGADSGAAVHERSSWASTNQTKKTHSDKAVPPQWPSVADCIPIMQHLLITVYHGRALRRVRDEHRLHPRQESVFHQRLITSVTRACLFTACRSCEEIVNDPATRAYTDGNLIGVSPTARGAGTGSNWTAAASRVKARVCCSRIAGHDVSNRIDERDPGQSGGHHRQTRDKLAPHSRHQATSACIESAAQPAEIRYQRRSARQRHPSSAAVLTALKVVGRTSEG